MTAKKKKTAKKTGRYRAKKNAWSPRRTPPSKRNPRDSGSRLTAIQKRVAENTLRTTDYEVQTYVPCEEDVKIAEAMLAGQVTTDEIASASGLTKRTVLDCLKNPTACAWVSRRVHENVAHRLGMVDAAMLRRALAGDVPAARLVLDRYDQLTHKSMHLNVSASADLERMEDNDLLALVKNSKPELENVIEAEVVEKPSEEDL